MATSANTITAQAEEFIAVIDELVRIRLSGKYAGTDPTGLLIRLNTLAKQLWPDTDFDIVEPPGKSSDFPKHGNLWEILRVECPRTREKIVSQLKRWKVKAAELAEKGRPLTENATEEIPPERQTPPLTLRQMAECFGAGITPKKLRKMIDDGHLKVKKIHRQSFVFDTNDLPDYVKKKRESRKLRLSSQKLLPHNI